MEGRQRICAVQTWWLMWSTKNENRAYGSTGESIPGPKFSSRIPCEWKVAKRSEPSSSLQCKMTATTLAETGGLDGEMARVHQRTQKGARKSSRPCTEDHGIKTRLDSVDQRSPSSDVSTFMCGPPQGWENVAFTHPSLQENPWRPWCPFGLSPLPVFLRAGFGGEGSPQRRSAVVYR